MTIPQFKEVKIMDQSIVKGSQSWDFKSIITIRDKKLNLFIKRDSYDHQNRCYIELWNGSEWKRVYNIPYQEMETNKLNAYADRAVLVHFLKDRKRLIENAIKIIF